MEVGQRVRESLGFYLVLVGHGELEDLVGKDCDVRHTSVRRVAAACTDQIDTLTRACVAGYWAS